MSTFLRRTAPLMIIILLSATLLQAQTRARNSQANPASPLFGDPPRLVVGIVVDQMRYDYLSRFWGKFSDSGFRRLVGDGFLCRNHHFNYAPTSTGPGHASVYTGTTPAVHGILGNDWFDVASGQFVYCAGDDSVRSVGTASDAGKNSPHRMLVSTITDQLRLHYQKRSKVIAIAIKDRGAVLPGGHMANAAYWFEGGATGQWITSSYYMEELPQWVRQFNASGAAAAYRKNWEPLKDINTYLESGPDNVPYEGLIDGEEAPVFPHKLPELWEANGMYGLLRITPFGNSLTTDFALEALKSEGLGADAVPDFLAISYSSTDYVGHFYGVDSKEVEDTYLRLDQDLGRLLKELDTKVGTGNYTVFLTADHGALPVAGYLADQKLPAGNLELQGMPSRLNEFLQYRYGNVKLVRNISNNQIFLDHELLRNLDLDPAEVQRTLAAELMSYEGIEAVYTATQMMQAEYTKGVPAILQKGFNPKRSGDLLLVLPRGYVNYSATGSTHGSPYPYDTHVPLLFYGKGISRGSLLRRTTIPDVAPTLAALLGVALPSGTTGEPIPEALD